MAKPKITYKCNSCGQTFSKWAGKCSVCNEWNTIEEIIETTNNKLTSSSKLISTAKAIKLKDVVSRKDDRIILNDSEIDRMFGGGIVKDSVNIISAPPGAGKSTFAMLLSGKLSKLGYSVLYASGEESETQIKNRALRVLKPEMMENLYLIADKYRRLETVLESIKDINPDFIVLDSIQTFTLDRCLPSRAGSPTQVVECATEITALCKDSSNPKACLIIGQMIKNDELAGPRQLEHLVDAVFYIEGDPYEELRLCTCSKNRFGEPETVFFDITNGMESVNNPSEFLLTKRKPGEIVNGSAITIIKEGTRPLAVEIESLISQSFTTYPSRLGEGLRKEQLNILISILEQRANINLFNKNVVVKAIGNMKLQETSVSLAILMSIASSFKKAPIDSGIVFVGEVGLTGEIKKAQSLEAKIKEAERMGFDEIVIPEQQIKGSYSIKVTHIKTIKECIDKYL